MPNDRLEGLAERLPKSLAGKGAAKTTQRPAGKGWRRKMTAEELAERVPRGLTGKATGEAAPKDWQNMLPIDLTGKIAADDADQSAERPVPRLAGCIRPLATAQRGAARRRKETWTGA